MGDVVELPTAAAEEERPQYMRALDRANKVRLERAALKRDVKAGRKTVAQVLESPPECALNMTITDLLLAQPRWGRTRIVKLLRDVPVSEMKMVGQMTRRQRKATVLLLTDPKLRATPAYRREPVLAL